MVNGDSFSYPHFYQLHTTAKIFYLHFMTAYTDNLNKPTLNYPYHQCIMKKILVLFLVVISSLAQAQLTQADLPRSGMNVKWQDFNYFTSSLPFTDAIKHGSNWYENPGFPVDEQGYPTQLSSGQEARMFIFLETTHYPTGDYTFTWEGEGEMSVQTCGETYSFDPASEKRQTITVNDNCESGIQLTITATNTDDHIRNLHLYLPGHDENSGYWTDHFVEYVANFGLVRFAWGSGMYAPIVNWEERRMLGDMHWIAGDVSDIGVPYEAMIALANQAQVDIWVSVPPRASDDYERTMAQMFRDNLNDNLRLWIEWGNEQWNCGEWGYEGCNYIYEQLESINDPEVDAPHIYGRETVLTTDNFIQIFEETGERHRLVNVLGAQADNAWQLQSAVDEIVRLEKMDNIDVMSVGPYFRQYEEFDPITPAIDQGMDAVFSAVDQLLDNLFDPSSVAGGELHANFAVAQEHNKPMVAYEGGQHFVSWIGMSDEMVADINRDARMYQVYRDYFDGWDEIGGATFVHYGSYGMYDRGEAFGMKEYYNQPLEENHKLRAALDWEAGVENVDDPVTSIQEAPLQGVFCYPNPASDMITLQYSASQDPVEVSLTNALGEKVLARQQSQYDGESLSLDVSAMPAGIYLLKVQQGQKSATFRYLIR